MHTLELCVERILAAVCIVHPGYRISLDHRGVSWLHPRCNSVGEVGEVSYWRADGQGSFKDVRCVNGGAVPLPPHGRQLESEVDIEGFSEEVCALSYSSVLLQQISSCRHDPILPPRWSTYDG